MISSAVRRSGCLALAAVAAMPRPGPYNDPTVPQPGRQRRYARSQGWPRSWASSTSRCDDREQFRNLGVPIQKTYEAELGFQELRELLKQLPTDEKRAALSLLGLALGDAAGLPFELGRGRSSRAKYHAAGTEAARKDLAKDLKLEQSKRRGQTPYVRTFSDDTTCCDLKMEAAAQAGRIDAERWQADGDKLLQQLTLQQYLKWAHTSKTKDDVGHHGELFQGTGAFTRDFLVPKYRGRNNEVARIVGNDLRELYEEHPVMGPFWPTRKFAEFAVDYFAGKYSFPSWGNGAVMSFAPHPILAGRWRKCPPSCGNIPAGLQDAAKVMSNSHQEPTAMLANRLLWELLDEVYRGSVAGSPGQLRDAASKLRSLEELRALDHECIPVRPLLEWLESAEHDCSIQTAEDFLRKLTGSRDIFDLDVAPLGVFGKMLHIAADWNDDRRTRLSRPGSKEPVLFSQRGLNSVIIAIWAASGARSPWEVVSRVIYVGGDTDTVGAVAGQVACPLLNESEVVDAFVDFVALGEKPETLALKIANAAARRYFWRALLFASGNLDEMRKRPSLLDDRYPPMDEELRSVLRGKDSARDKSKL
mmetsp:Transcript_40888/g.117448  ORF Transcript_40888/g.117448 Transcript_40888/m.117448 type:complete len:589 (-) Transcript_40888:156-1922(-)